MYYINTLKRELVDINAYKLQPSLSERVFVYGRGCHTALNFGVKAKENQDKVPIKQDFITLHVMTEMQFLLWKKTKKYHAWACQNVCDALSFLLDNIFNGFSTKLYK